MKTFHEALCDAVNEGNDKFWDAVREASSANDLSRIPSSWALWASTIIEMPEMEAMKAALRTAYGEHEDPRSAMTEASLPENVQDWVLG